MPGPSTRPLNPDESNADQQALLALKNIGDYAPANPAYSTEALMALADTAQQAKQAKLAAKKALGIARNKELAAVRALHEGILNAKLQVLAQYGADSFEIQALGLKRISEHKRPSRQKQPES